MKRVGSLCAFGLFLVAGLACQKGAGQLSVKDVEPDQGIMGGGDRVVIHGSGFVPGKTQVEVRFGRRRAEQVSIASANQISVITPPGEPGPVDVTLMFDSGEQFKIDTGFRFVSPTNPGDTRKAFFDKQRKEGTNTTTSP